MKELGLQLVIRPQDVIFSRPRLNVGLARHRGELFELNALVWSIVGTRSIIGTITLRGSLLGRSSVNHLSRRWPSQMDGPLKAWAIHFTVVVSCSTLFHPENETCPVHEALFTSSMTDDEPTTFAKGVLTWRHSGVLPHLLLGVPNIHPRLVEVVRSLVKARELWVRFYFYYYFFAREVN